MMSTKESTLESNSRRSEISAEGGAWVFIFGDLTIFTILFVAFIYQHGLNPDQFSSSRKLLNVNLGALNTVILLTSSLFIVHAVRALERNNTRCSRRFLIGGWLLGALFVAIKISEYVHKVNQGISPNTNEFFMYYFILTGLHLFHVLVGLCIITAMYFLARSTAVKSLEKRWFEGGALFWHLVDLLWVIIFPLVYLVS